MDKPRQCKDCGQASNQVAWVTKQARPGGLLCLACTAARRKAWLVLNPEKRIAANKATAQWQAQNAEYRAAQCRAYYYKQGVRERILELRKAAPIELKQVWRTRSKKWAKQNRPYLTAATRKYTLSKNSRTPKWLSASDELQIASMYSFAKIMEACTGNAYQVDHVIPLQGKLVSGLHTPYNLQVLTAADNLAKGNKYGQA